MSEKFNFDMIKFKISTVIRNIGFWKNALRDKNRSVDIVNVQLEVNITMGSP